MKFLIVAECTMKEEVELEYEPTGPELLEAVANVNKDFKERGLKAQVNQIRATYIPDPIEEA